METINSQTNVNKKPLLKRYLSITEYLKAYYDYRKLTDSSFSYERWSNEFNFKSKSSLQMMCVGRRNISKTLIKNFCEKENLSDSEKCYFLLLAKLQNTNNVDMKKTYLDKIFELTDFNFKTNEIKNAFDFVSNPEMCIVQVLLAVDDLEATEENLAKIAQLKLKKIKAILQKLKNLGLCFSIHSEKNEKVIWKAKYKFFTVNDESQDLALNFYHLQTAKELEKVVSQNIIDKKMKSLLLTIGESDYSELVEIIDQFTNKLKVKYASDSIKNKKLFKINVQAYPVTNEVKL